MINSTNNEISGYQLDLLETLEMPENSDQNNGRMLLDASSSNPASSPEPSQGAKPFLPEMILIVDTETTGLDPAQDQCLEVGVILFYVPSRKVLAQQSFLLPVKSNKAEFINKIPSEITRLTQPVNEALLYLKSLVDRADLMVAHNASFDKQWFGKEPLPSVLKPWLCTMEDISWPENLQLRSRPSVRDLALAHGVPVWSAHRALTDCIYLADVFSRCDDLEKLLLHGLEPRKLMKALVSYEDRHLAKKCGFKWNDPVKGAWTRRLSEREKLKLEFSVEPV